MPTALERRGVLAHLPTPVIALDRLAARLGRRAGTLLAKLDDTTGLAAGGNNSAWLGVNSAGSPPVCTNTIGPSARSSPRVHWVTA